MEEAEAAAVAAFHEQIIHRVCAKFKENTPDVNADVVDQLEKTWKQSLKAYTGSVNDVISVIQEKINKDATEEQASGITQPTSERVGVKRRRGLDDDASTTTITTAMDSTHPTATSTDIIPVNMLPVSDFPSTLAAYCKKMSYSRPIRAYRGTLESIVLTRVRPLGPKESLCGGDMLWVPHSKAQLVDNDIGADLTEDGSDTSIGLVQFIRDDLETSKLVVKSPHGEEIYACKAQVRRFQEHIIQQGEVICKTNS